MRPFRFFFMFSLGLMLFFFVARFLFFAFIVAAVFSLVYFIGRKFLSFFRRLDWDEEPYHGYRRRKPKAVWKNDLLLDYPIRLETEIRAERVIQVL